MHTVREEAASSGHRVIRLPYDGFIEATCLGPVITFNHCIGLLNSLHGRVRF